jgi:hypothetical protein
VVLDYKEEYHMGSMRSLTQRVHDLNDKKSKDTPESLMKRCMAEADKLLRTYTSSEKTEGHLRRALDLISALNLLADMTDTDVSETVADLTSKAADLPAALQYLNHSITKALSVRELKAAQVEYQLQKKLSFWRGPGSISWLMSKNDWDPEDIVEYLQVHGSHVPEDVVRDLREAIRYHADAIEDRDRGLA